MIYVEYNFLNEFNNVHIKGRKSGLVVKQTQLTFQRLWVQILSYPKYWMDMVNVKAMPGSIPAPNSGSFVEKIRKNIGSQRGKLTKKH